MADQLRPRKQTQLAQQFDPRDKKVHLNEIPIPTTKPNQLLVKIASASLCHSDLMPMESSNHGLLVGDGPITVGHEGVGYVVEAGPETSGFKPGDAVGFLPAIDCCFDCYCCRNVHNSLCTNGQVKMQGFATNGYFQEYVAIDYRQAMVLPSNLVPGESAPLFCAGVTAYHGVDDCELKPGQWIAIVGCGGLGHLGVQYAKAMGLGVVAIDIVDEQLEDAKANGADHVFNSRTDPNWIEEVMKCTNGGADAVVNFTASKRSYDDCPNIVRPGKGLIMVVGIPNEPLEFRALDLTMGRYQVKASSNGTNYNMVPAIEFSAKHGIKAHLNLFKLEEVPKMIELMQSGRARGRLGVRFD